MFVKSRSPAAAELLEGLQLPGVLLLDLAEVLWRSSSTCTAVTIVVAGIEQVNAKRTTRLY